MHILILIKISNTLHLQNYLNIIFMWWHTNAFSIIWMKNCSQFKLLETWKIYVSFRKRKDNFQIDADILYLISNIPMITQNEISYWNYFPGFQMLNNEKISFRLFLSRLVRRTVEHSFGLTSLAAQAHWLKKKSGLVWSQKCICIFEYPAVKRIETNSW